MSDAVQSLILDLLEWLGDAPRDYHEVMQVWRTSCPQLPVWEEANAKGLITQSRDARGRVWVALTPTGRELIVERRPVTARCSIARAALS